MQSRVLGLLLVGILVLSFPFVTFGSPSITNDEAPIHALSSLDGGVQGFLERRQSALAHVTIEDEHAGALIEHIAWYYNVEVRIVLAMLESHGGLITAQKLDPKQLEQPFTAGPIGFKGQIDWVARELKAGFGPYESDVTLTFTDGTRTTLKANADPHTLAVKRFLAPGRTQAEWDRAVADYIAAYDTLFRDEPLAQPATPPASQGFLSAPWLPGTRVIHSSHFDHAYPMVDDGGDGNDLMINYQGRTGLSYNGHDGHDYYFPDKPYGTPIVAAAPGWAYARTTRGLGVLIQHTDQAKGYESVYWHLEAFAPSFKSIIDGEARWVERGELLGWSGATGFTDGAPHLHFEIRHNGKQVDPYGWYGTGSDPCAKFKRCETSVWLWNESVSWQRPDAPAAPDRVPPQALLTLNPPSNVRLALQFNAGVLPSVGTLPAAADVGFTEGRWDQAAIIGPDAALSFPVSPTLPLEAGTFATWVKVPEQWDTSGTGRHYLFAASANPADPKDIYSNTIALRHETKAAQGQAVWTFWTVDENGIEHRLSVPDTLKAGWHHIAVSWEQKSGVKSLVLDGTLVATARNTAFPTSVGETLEIGRWSFGASELDTALDEVMLYSDVLLPSTIQALTKAEGPQVLSRAFTQNSELVILTPAADNSGGIVQVQLGIDGKYAAPLPYSRSYRWHLPVDEGSYTVSARLTDRVGNTTTLSQTITIDQPPNASVLLESWSPLTATLTISATDTGMPLEMALAQTPTPLFKHWEPLTMSRLWHWLPMQPRRIYIWVRDVNGNERGPLIAGPDLWQMYLPHIER